MNPISHFKKVEKNEQRRDPHEGISSIAQVDWIKLKRKDDGVEFEFRKDSEKNCLVSAQLREDYPDRTGNLYCMYGISTEWTYRSDRIDPRNQGFGGDDPHMVIIHQPSQFLKRIGKVLEEMELTGGHGGVTYYDPESYHGDLGIFF